MNNWKDVKISGHGITEILPWHLHEGTQENHGAPPSDNQCLSQASNHTVKLNNIPSDKYLYLICDQD